MATEATASAVAGASTPGSDGAAIAAAQEGPKVMTEFVIALTAFCSLIFIFSVAFVIIFIAFKRMHRDDESEGEYIGDEESLPESQHGSQHQQQAHRQQPIRNGRLPAGAGHTRHTLSMWDTYPTYHVREMTIAEKFWRADTIRNPMHRGPEHIY